MEALEQRFWMKVHKTDGCWLWTAHTLDGYGYLKRNRKSVRAHRISWELHHDLIPERLCVLHKCDIRACVNPDHLFLGTNADNTADMIIKGRHPRGGARGEAGGHAKLTTTQVLEIRSRQGQTQRALAKEFGVSQGQIGRIRLGRKWAHVGIQ